MRSRPLIRGVDRSTLDPLATFLAAAFVAAAFCIACGSDDPLRRPADDRFVLDRAQIVPDASEERMNRLLDAMLGDTDVELLAIATPSLDGVPISRFANGLFERWRVGDRTRGNRGLLLVVAAEEARVRFQVAYGLEGVFPDAFVSYVEHEQMAPYFARGRIGEGIEATVELIAGRAYREILGHAYDPEAESPGDIGGFRSGGAGAEAAVPLDEPDPGPAPAADAGLRSRFAAAPTPEAAWERFLEANRRRIKDPGLGIYDDSAQRMLAGVVSNAGQDHIARLYSDAAPTIRQRGDRAAVVFLDDPDHLLAPWFFHRTGAGWQLDGRMYPDVIGYNHLNQWRFRRRDHPYMFAFEDFRFDRHGFAFHEGRP